MNEEKQKLIDLIDNEQDIDALIKYMNDYRTQKEDIIYFLQSFQKIEKTIESDNINFLKFYEEYIRAIIIALKHKVLENTAQMRQDAERIISIAMNNSDKRGTTFLYAARFYALMYKAHIEEYINKKDTTFLYYTKAESMGSKFASKEKENFSKMVGDYEEILREREEERKNRETHKLYNLDYYNSECDLTDLLNTFLKNTDQNFSMLLYGPENSGMKEFACKLFACSGRNYVSIAANSFFDRASLPREMKDYLDEYDAFILHNVNSCFYRYNRFEDDKDFKWEKNIQYLINTIEENNYSFILIVDDISKLPQNLLDAFTLKIKFDYMNKEQKQAALQNTLHITSDKLDETNGLVYGDFLRIKEKADFLNISDENEIIEMLKKEADFEKAENLKEIEEHKTYNLDYYNADCNLISLVDVLSNNIKYKNLSILLYGPENAGMKEFACKLFALSSKDYTCVDVADMKNRNSVEEFIDGISQKYNDFILHNINSCISLYNRFEDNKDFILEQNVQYLINKISENKHSFALITDDIQKLPQNLLNAFTLKIKFDYMNKEQKQAALQNIFHITSDKLDETNGLVYGDFLRIKEKANFLNISDENEIIEMLKKEADSKPSFLTYSTPVLEFDINLINTNTDVVKLTNKLEKTSLPFTMLISGPAGTGKSYYLRYLASRMNMNVIEKTAAELFSRYQGEPAKNVLNLFKEAEDQNAIIILDEVEKITMQRGREGDNPWRSDMTNAFLTCLENAKYPFMATTNFIADIDKAILRRFVFKLNFDYLKPEQIAYAFRHTFNLEPPAELFKIGGLTNGDFAVVKKKAQILDCMTDTHELYEMLKEEVSVKAVGRVVHIEKEINYDRNFINIEGNSLDLYVKKIKEEHINNFSILLHGPSGTGKSLYLRQLAYDLGYEVIERRTSDILSKWIGESEKNIAQAFEEAKNHRAMLIFDEVDSFLPNKSGVRQVHDTQMVNEFLVQLENHPYPVCATTNYIDYIERASIRRFKIEAKFDYLKKDQYGYVYRKTFGFEPSKDIEKLTELTPAIFALAAEKVALEDVGTDEKRVFEIFLDEVKKSTGKKILEDEDKTYEQLAIEEQVLYKTPITENYDKILTGFVKIITDTGHGSGFFITKDGFILTNKHVVKEQKIVEVELFSGRTVPAEVIRTNSLDVALIKISKENKVYPMPIRVSELGVGSTVFSLGNPKYTNQVLSKGCITRYTMNNDAQRIETDCVTNSGSSGGPLLDGCGNVIGINVEGRLDDAGLKLGLNLHLSINDALNVLNIKVKN